MTPPIPSADIQEQYAIVFTLLFFACLIAAAFYKMWRELLKWITEQETKRDAERKEQDDKREIEREKQRDWQADQDRVRDERWQSFLKNLQDEWIKQDGRHSSVLTELVKKVDELSREIRDHDGRVRRNRE
jgi:Flp pilus assembly protein TadB